MAYATQADIVDLYGPNALVVADRAGDGTIDEVAVGRALASASAEIDAYIGVRYPLPLPSVPAFLQTVAVDIAIYRLALSHDVLSDEHRRRYDDALAFLKRVGEGRAALQVAAAEASEAEVPADAGPRPMLVSGPERVFSRAKMEGL